MKIVRLTSCVIVLQMLWLFAGCCSTNFTITYEWKSLELAHLDNSGAAPGESSEPSIPAHAYGIRMKLDTTLISVTGSSAIPTAQATSCAHTETYINRDTVRSLRIHEIASNPAAPLREVTDDFRMIAAGNPLSGISGAFIPIPDMVTGMNRSGSNPFVRIDLIRMKNFQRSNDIRFIVTMELSGGKTLADTTLPVSLI